MTRLTEQEQLKLGGDIQRRLGIKTSRNEPLARFSTMRVGGPADLFAEIYNLFELRGIARFARSRDIPLFLIGGGSDLIISDAGIGGLVVRVRASAVQTDGERIVADPGVLMAKIATEGKKAGLSGFEFGLAIPGTVGGSVWANAGAHGSDVKGVLESATVVGADGEERQLGPDEMAMAYRDTQLKHSASGKPDVVLQATFALEPAEPDTIAERLGSIRRWRQEHQPIGQKSAGSVFRNPEGDSAGRIIDELGLKEHRLGGAQVSPKHANYIVTTGGATAADVRGLGELVRETVRRERGIELAYEVEFVGDWPASEEGT